MSRLRFAVMLASAVAFAGAAKAEVITYTFQGVGSGTLGAMGFTGAPFTVTLVGDTGNVTTGGTEQFNQATSATFNIDGVASGQSHRLVQ